MENYDVVIVGAGLSGISAGVHLKKYCPNKSFIILEGRERMGGTWDLFKYPGIRSDSDMFTFGYSFKPWLGKHSIADGADIKNYIVEAATDYDLHKHIAYQQKVVKSEWLSTDKNWTLDVEQADGSIKQITANFVMVNKGYYNYKTPHLPEFKGKEDFKGEIIHPQFWPENYDYTDKKVVVIGSGATAITIVPAMAKKAKLVTMLQRSPTYMASRPRADKFTNYLYAKLPQKSAYRLARVFNIFKSFLFYSYSKKNPEKVKKQLLKFARMQLKSKEDFNKHFEPKYMPWDQRLCLVTDGDLYKGINKGKIKMVTDHIDKFTENGITLKSGNSIEADIIVTATGLNLVDEEKNSVYVDGKKIDSSQCMFYKGVYLSSIPNMSFGGGYTNASWTLKIDLTNRYICRILNYMDKKGYKYSVAEAKDSSVKMIPLVELSAGYINRAIHQYPKQGNKRPWKVVQNFYVDLVKLKYLPLKDNALGFFK